MGLTQYYVAQSLDGYIAEVDGNLDWLTSYDGDASDGVPQATDGDGGPSQATDGAYDRFFAQVGVLAMGSTTYEWILAEVDSWPYEGTPCWVFTSRELAVPEGADVRFADGPVAPVHEEMRAEAGERNVWVVGGGNLASQFATEGLLDELIVTVVPVVLGDGLPTFAQRLGDQPLRRSGTHPFKNGMTELRYEFVR